MRDFSSIDFKGNVRFVVRRELKSLGIKVPKYKLNNKQVSRAVRVSHFGFNEIYYRLPSFISV